MSTVRSLWCQRLVSRWLIWLALCVVGSYAVSAPPAAEARSGSSFGGGFRSRSSSSSSSRSFGSSSSSRRSSFSSSTSRSSGSSSSWGTGTGWNSRRSTTVVPVPVPVPIGMGYGGAAPATYSYGPSADSGFGASIPLIVFVIILIIVVIAVRRSRAGGSSSASTGANKADVTVLQLGILHAARDLQDVLEQLAAGAASGTEAALATALSGAVAVIRSRTEYIEYAYGVRQSNLSLPKAEDQFMWLAQNERSKYNREVLRVDDKGVQTQQKEWKTDGIRDEDGQLAVHEFFVVTIIVASRDRPFPAVVQTTAQVDEALDALAKIDAAHLVALEVIWSPSARSDAMGRDDLESRYPELRQL